MEVRNKLSYVIHKKVLRQRGKGHKEKGMRAESGPFDHDIV
jgi:hypothetical protein